LQWERYLEGLDTADGEDEVRVDNGAVTQALERLRQHREPEVGFMKTSQGMLPAYNVQTAVDAEHGLIVAQKVSNEPADNRSLLPMAEAAQAALGGTGSPLHVVADAGYSNGEQAASCESQGMVPHIPAKRGVNTRGRQLFDRTAFRYQEQSNTMLCPAGQSLRSDGRSGHALAYVGRAEVCGACALKPQCTKSPRRVVHRHLYEGALDRMQQRATPAAMALRRSTVEHPFANLKYRIFGHPRFLVRGLEGARCEIALAVMVYNLKRMLNLVGGETLKQALQTT
jgi:transposase